MPKYWYTIPNASSDPLNPTSYSKLDGKPSCPTVGPLICAILADAGNLFPTATQFVTGENMNTYINQALTSPYIPRPAGAGQKIYVYTKPDT